MLLAVLPVLLADEQRPACPRLHQVLHSGPEAHQLAALPAACLHQSQPHPVAVGPQRPRPPEPQSLHQGWLQTVSAQLLTLRM